MNWPQPCTPIQTDNSTAVGITNHTIVPQKPSPWISAYGGTVGINPKNSFATTGTKAATIWPLTIPNITRLSTMNPTDPHMQAQQLNNYGTQ